MGLESPTHIGVALHQWNTLRQLDASDSHQMAAENACSPFVKHGYGPFLELYVLSICHTSLYFKGTQMKNTTIRTEVVGQVHNEDPVSSDLVI